MIALKVPEKQFKGVHVMKHMDNDHNNRFLGKFGQINKRYIDT